MSRMRQRIAARLKEAQNTNAMLTTFNELDMRQVSFISVYMHKYFIIFYSLFQDVWFSDRYCHFYYCII